MRNLYCFFRNRIIEKHLCQVANLKKSLILIICGITPKRVTSWWGSSRRLSARVRSIHYHSIFKIQIRIQFIGFEKNEIQIHIH